MNRIRHFTGSIETAGNQLAKLFISFTYCPTSANIGISRSAEQTTYTSSAIKTKF